MLEWQHYAMRDEVDQFRLYVLWHQGSLEISVNTNKYNIYFFITVNFFQRKKKQKKNNEQE